jgi:outer membrane protein TolC
MMKSEVNGLFDQVTQISQYRPVMKWPAIFSLLLTSILAIQAQTNAYTEPGTNTLTVITNIPDTYTNALVTYSNAPAIEVCHLSLEDCIQMTLQHYLELQIDRYDPQIAMFALRSAYGGYEPSLSLSGEHDHNESSRQQNVPIDTGTNVVFVPLFVQSASDNNVFSSTLSGVLPWGTTYSLDGNANNIHGFNNSPGNTYENSFSAASATLTQPFLKNFWIDNTRLTIRINKNRLKYSELALKLQIMTAITQLEQSYYDLIYNRQNVVVQQLAVESAEALVRENEKRLQVGALAPLDLASAQAQAAQSRAAVIAAKSQLATQERTLKKFIDEQFLKWVDVTIEPTGTLEANYQPFDRQGSWKKALTQRPEMLQAKLDVERNGIQLKYDRNQLFPQLDVFGTWGYNGSGREFSGALGDLQGRNQNSYVYGGKISVPLGGNIGARNAYKSDKASLQQLVLTVKRWERDIMIAIDNDIGTLQSDYDQVLATRAQRMYEEQALDAEQKKLQNGKSTTYQVLLKQRDLTQARGAEIQALDTYNKALAQLSLDEGTTLERLHIKWDAK